MSSKISVLVVEDELLIRMSLVEYLSDEGFEVFEAANADEAISILGANGQIQVMFTDIDMPGSMDGLKLSIAVRDRWPPVRIVVTSGHHAVALTDLPEGGLFCPKPYDHAAIATSLRDVLLS